MRRHKGFHPQGAPIIRLLLHRPNPDWDNGFCLVLPESFPALVPSQHKQPRLDQTLPSPPCIKQKKNKSLLYAGQQPDPLEAIKHRCPIWDSWHMLCRLKGPKGQPPRRRWHSDVRGCACRRPRGSPSSYPQRQRPRTSWGSSPEHKAPSTRPVIWPVLFQPFYRSHGVLWQSPPGIKRWKERQHWNWSQALRGGIAPDENHVRRSLEEIQEPMLNGSTCQSAMVQ